MQNLACSTMNLAPHSWQNFDIFILDDMLEVLDVLLSRECCDVVGVIGTEVLLLMVLVL